MKTLYSVFARVADDFPSQESKDFLNAFSSYKSPTRRNAYEFLLADEARLFIEKAKILGLILNIRYKPVFDRKNITANDIFFISFPFFYDIFDTKGRLNIKKINNFEIVTDGDNNLIFNERIKGIFELYFTSDNFKLIESTDKKPWYLFSLLKIAYSEAFLKTYRLDFLRKFNEDADIYEFSADGRISVSKELISSVNKLGVVLLNRIEIENKIYFIGKCYLFSGDFCRLLTSNTDIYNENITPLQSENDPILADRLCELLQTSKE
jgi:hypothetical protein